jgi:hypothetical protein
LRISGEQAKSFTPLLIASGATIAAGSIAAYFKIKADNRYEEYLSRGDPGTLDRVHEFDRYSAIALLTSELSFVIFSYLLLSR